MKAEGNDSAGEAMTLVTLKAILDEDRQLHITLPDEMPPGPVEVTVKSVPAQSGIALGPEVSREQARAILAQAGLLSMARYASSNADQLAAEEQEEPISLPEGAPDTSTLIEESRRERWD
jgi:hypothetical protein